MSFIEGMDRGQAALLPPGIDDFIAPDALVRVVAQPGGLESPSWGKPKKQIRGDCLTLVTESTDKVACLCNDYI